MPALMRHNGIPMVFQPAPSFTFFDPPIVYVEVEQASEYEKWRQWRRAEVSLEAELWCWETGKAMWEAKHPWWAMSF